MRLSRKPKNLVIVMLMAVFLMTMAGIAAAVPVVNWNFANNAAISTVSGSVYDNQVTAAGQVYATVYANVYGTLVATNIVNQDIYSKPSFSVSLAGKGLISGQSYPVGLVVYAAAYDQLPVALIHPAPTQDATRTFRYYVQPSSEGSTPSGGSNGAGSGSGGGTTPSTPATTAPSVTASLGTPVAVTASTGATIKAEGVTIAIPAGALAANVKVTVSEVVATAALAPAKGSALVSAILEIVKDASGNFSKPITLSMDFDAKKVDSNKFDVKICFFDEAKKSWTPLDNVKVDLTTGKVSGDVTHFTKFAVLTFPKEAAKPAASGLKDITGHWAAANIQKLVDSKAIAGYPDGTFKPNNTITRAEFATILVKALKLQGNGKVFADTANHWAKDSIAAAAAAGIVNGYSATQFGPNDLITREQMAVMIAKAAKLAAADGKTFSDSKAVAAWAKDAVAAVSAVGIISGYPDGSFGPKANATRAEAATVIVKIMK